MGMEELFELEAPVSAPRSSVPFRGRLFAFVLQTGRLLFFTWHRRPRCICHIPLLIFFTPASHWLGCISRGTRAPYRSYDPRRNSAEPPRGTLAKLGRPRPHGPRPVVVACGVRLEFGEIIFFYQKKIEPETTSRHRPGAPPRTARAHRSAIAARRSSIADRRSAVGLGGKETAGRSTPARPVLKLQKTRISRIKQPRRAIRL